MKTLVTNGLVVTAADTFAADILIEDGKIAALGHNLGSATDTIDAQGMYVFPGGIDEHVHFGLPFGGTMSAPWETESIAAAVGGTTTVLDFAMQPVGGMLSDGIRRWREEKATGKAAVDYGLHVAVCDLRPDVIAEIPRIVEEGVPTLKCFMAYKGTPLMVDDETLFRTLQKARTVGALVLVHQENGHVVDVLQKELLAAGKTAPKYHAVSRPPACEAEAAGRAIALAEMAAAPLFIVHVTAAQCVEQIRQARRRGLPIYGETCTHYLTLTEDELARPDFEGAKYVCSPPLREKWHQQELWQALQDNTLQAVGSDHCAFNFKGQKELGRENFALIPNGCPGVEERLAVLYTCGVLPGHLTLNRLVEISATAPARFHGLYPRKGTIAVGCDADLVLFNPDTRWTISAGTQKSAVDYTIFEGFAMHGAVQTVLLRGQVIVRDRAYVGHLTQGQFVKRTPYGAAYAEHPTVPVGLREAVAHAEAGDREEPILHKAGVQAEP